MTTQLIQTRIDSILQFMLPHWSWVNCHMVNYLTDHHWQTYVPLDLQKEVTTPDLIPECIKNVFWCSENPNNLRETLPKFPQFEKLLQQTKQHSLHNFKDIIITPQEFEVKILKVATNLKQQIHIKEFLTEKKQHEVEITAGLINDLVLTRAWSQQCIIVDAGDGKGYLSSRLALEYGFKVLGIDSNPSNTENAIKRNNKLKKAWNGLKERAELQSEGITPPRRVNWKQKRQQNSSEDFKLKPLKECNNYKTIDTFITSDMDIVSLLKQQFPQSDSNILPTICLTGLHTCGNLAPTCLKLFHEQTQCKLMCNIGCCYHLLKEEFSGPEFFGNKEVENLNQEIGFPLSKYLKEKQVKLGRNARMLAAQSLERTMAAQELPNISLYYRALLELLICEQHSDLKNTVQVGKIRKFQNFKEYVELCIKKHPNLNLSYNRVLEIEMLEEMRQNKDYLDLFYLIRMTFAPVLESLILLDRFLYLKEMGHVQSYLMPVFDPIVSPRHFAIVAIKSEN